MNNATHTATITHAEASALFSEALPNCGHRNRVRESDDYDDVAWWSCDVFDLDTGGTIGSAMVFEHWPEVEITWA